MILRSVRTTVACCVVLASPAFLQGDLLAVMAKDQTTKVLVSIDPISGGALPVGGHSMAVGGFSTGVSALASFSSHVLYFSANAPGESSRRLFAVDRTSGMVLTSPRILSSPAPVLNTTPAFLFLKGTQVYGLLNESLTSKYLVRIDPRWGTTTVIGPPLPIGGYAGGIAAYDDNNDIIYFPATDGTTPDWRIYSVRVATGALIADPPIAAPADFVAAPILLALDKTGQLLTLLGRASSPEKSLMFLSPDSGEAKQIGGGFPMGGFSSGISAFDYSSGILYFCANAPGEGHRRIYSIHAETGVLLRNPVITAPLGYSPFPIALIYDPNPFTGGSPGHVPDGSAFPGVPLTIQKSVSSPGNLDLAWGSSCLAGGADYAVYAGLPGNYGQHAPLLCTTGGALAASLPCPADNTYFLIVPLSSTLEGSYGVDSHLNERPAGDSPCRPAQRIDACP